MSAEVFAMPTSLLTRAAPHVDGRVSGGFDTMPVHNPARISETVGEVALVTAAGTDEAVAAAVRAFPEWRDLGTAGRAALLLDAVAAVEAEADAIGLTVAREVGKTAREAVGDVRGALALVRGAIATMTEIEAAEDRTGQPGTGNAVAVRVRTVPVGPVAVIGPWNTPVFLTFNGIAPALASGCTVVVKPPVEAPLGLSAVVRMIAERLPAGVLNLVPGRGSVVGQRLAEHPDIRAVMFTGSTRTGSTIAAAAARTVKKLGLELGGNDPAIVLADADLSPTVIAELIAGSFAMTGQICFNIKRIYVHRSRYDEFTRKFCAAAARIRVGDPLDPRVHIGPLATRDGYENALRLVASAEAAGATVSVLGQRDDATGWNDGYFVAPTVVTGIDPDHELVLDEQFSPIMPIVPFDTDEEAVREANRTEFGLASSVWSSDLAHAEAVARRIEAGNTYINAHRLGASVPHVPFGGMKQSGLGRTHGQHSFHACTEEQGIVVFSDAHAQLPGLEPWLTTIDEGACA